MICHQNLCTIRICSPKPYYYSEQKYIVSSKRISFGGFKKQLYYNSDSIFKLEQQDFQNRSWDNNVRNLLQKYQDHLSHNVLKIIVLQYNCFIPLIKKVYNSNTDIKIITKNYNLKLVLRNLRKIILDFKMKNMFFFFFFILILVQSDCIMKVFQILQFYI